MNSQFKHKMAQATVDDIVQRCCCQWHRTVLPEFRNDGEPWIVSYDMPPEFPAFRHGQLELKNDEILSSFRPSISLIRKMVLFSVRRMRDAQGIQPSVSAINEPTLVHSIPFYPGVRQLLTWWIACAPCRVVRKV